jgi:hypothetical protein
MSDPSIARFLALLNHRPELRERVKIAEEALQAAVRQQADAIAEIAADSGYDVADWNARPRQDEPVSTFSCCGFMTWGTWSVEQALK